MSSLSTKSLKERQAESDIISSKHPTKIPIIVLASDAHAADLPKLDKNKFLVTKDLTTGQFLYIIRKRMKLEPHHALFLFTEKGTIPVTHMPLVSVFDEHVNEDGFLYFKYSSENAFGA
jgi:GABA(A) receptor-associated protein